MNTNRECGCKSFRTCKLCEQELGLEPQEEGRLDNREVWEYDLETGQCVNEGGEVRPHSRTRDFPGILVVQDFISEDEETQLLADLDVLPWDMSQSGRRKQNFGPRANFNKRKAKVGQFAGFPQPTRFIQERFDTLPVLESYR